jgi:alkylation response protein AidB-like acyl-CoA dehydrogenase
MAPDSTAVPLSAAQLELRDAAIDFAHKQLGHDAAQLDESGTFAAEAWRRCADYGVLGLPFPEAWGGQGESIEGTIAVMEGLGYGCRDHGLLFSINAHMWACTMPILQFGSDAQKERWLPELCSGRKIAANAASEPDSGSDVFSMRTRAVPDGDDYLLDGSKMFVTNAPVADLFVLYATLDPSYGAAGICCFVIEKGTAGLRVSRPIGKMGLRSSPMAEVSLEACRVPRANLLGQEGRGVPVFHSSMVWERACILAACVGAMARQLEECVAYARQRAQFGKPIGKYQAVANRIVDMKVRLDNSQMLVYRVGRLKQAGHSAEMESAIAKLYISEAHVASSLDALRVHGGYGYTSEYPYEREVRDALGGTLYSGTSDIQRNLIARALGL